MGAVSSSVRAARGRPVDLLVGLSCHISQNLDHEPNARRLLFLPTDCCFPQGTPRVIMSRVKTFIRSTIRCRRFLSLDVCMSSENCQLCAGVSAAYLPVQKTPPCLRVITQRCCAYTWGSSMRGRILSVCSSFRQHVYVVTRSLAGEV